MRWLISIELGQGAQLARLCIAVVVVKLVWYVAESQRKLVALGRSPEETSGLFGLVAYTWLNPLLRKGYCNVLHLKDLDKLDQHLATKVLYQKLSIPIIFLIHTPKCLSSSFN